MSDDYKIKYSSKDQFFMMVIQRIGGWFTQLNTLEKDMAALSGMESFQGTTAQSVKAYLNEVHNILLISVRQTLYEFQQRLSLYSNGYYEFEPNIYANICSQTLRKLKERAVSEQNYLDGQNRSVQAQILRIADLAYLKLPSQENVMGALTDAVKQIDTLDCSIVEYEMGKKNEANGDLASLISSLRQAIDAFYYMKGNITGYTSGDYSRKTEVLNLYNQVSASMEYTSQNQDAVIEASENLQNVFAQQQEDYEEACENRKDEGTANMILGGLAVVGGVTAIVLTAGAATPIVVVAGVSGTCAAAYGVSNFAEGAQDYYYGSIGDLSTDAWNPIRDTVFCGNQALYDAWGGLSLTIAGLCVPVNSAVNSVAGATGKVIAKEVTKTVVKESVKGYVIGETSEHITNYVADELDLNKTQTVILNQVVEKGLEKGIDVAEDGYVRHRDGAADGDFTDRMSYEDAQRYNAFMNDPDGYRASMDGVDVSGWNGSDGGASDGGVPNGSAADGSAPDGGDSLHAPNSEPLGTHEADYSTTANTPEEEAILRDMEAKGEYDMDGQSYGPIEVDAGKLDPKEPGQRLPTDKNGTIIGERESGTFEYVPDDAEAQNIMSSYGEYSVKYVDGEPDFSPFAKQDTQWGSVDCQVEIGHMVGERQGNSEYAGNYQQADIALSEKISSETGQTVTSNQIKAYREAAHLTWHETSDGKTMQLIPTEINKSCAHKGGVAAKKYEQAWGDVALNY